MPSKKGYKRTKRTVKKKETRARLYEDGSVRITGPRGSRSVPNVGEGGKRRGGSGTVRAFGPSGVPDRFRGRPVRPSTTHSRTRRNTTGAEGGKKAPTKLRKTKTMKKRSR